MLTINHYGQVVPLAPKAFDLLLALVSNHGRLLTRETLMKTIWPDSFVEETNLTVNISLLRKALGDTDDGRPWIATAPKRGYRFDGAVTLHDDTPPRAHLPHTLRRSLRRQRQYLPGLADSSCGCLPRSC
jgi:DNA-binding winged helix-turn-helix (wHTH) protein